MQRFASLSADSPCTGRCELSETDSCIGCGRTVSEIGQWVSLTQSQRQQLLHELARRRQACRTDSSCCEAQYGSEGQLDSKRNSPN